MKEIMVEGCFQPPLKALDYSGVKLCRGVIHLKDGVTNKGRLTLTYAAHPNMTGISTEHRPNRTTLAGFSSSLRIDAVDVG